MWKANLTVACWLLLASCASADQIAWTDWTSAGADTVGGVMNFSSGPVNVTYAGHYAFAQTTTGIDYWVEHTPAPYTNNSVVDNAPIPIEMIALNLQSTHTISFSQAVLNPVMAIVSQGRQNNPVTYDFDRSFSVLSEGHGYWGDGWYTTGAGDVLNGYEFHGVIQFNGWVNSVSWTSAPGEYWHGFAFGAPEVPAPTSLAGVLGLGAMGLIARIRRRVAK